jgi:16S rRNA processing protein RimM
MALVIVGRLGRPHGLAGELGLDGCSLTPEELTAVGSFTWRGRGQEPRQLTLAEVRPVHMRLLVRFAGVHDRDRAAELTNGELLAEASALPDPGPDVAYTFQLIGLRVQTEEGRLLGTLQDVVATGAHPIYVVQGDRELLVPATGEIVKRVDLSGGVITVALPAGLEDL